MQLKSCVPFLGSIPVFFYLEITTILNLVLFPFFFLISHVYLYMKYYVLFIFKLSILLQLAFFI